MHWRSAVTNDEPASSGWRTKKPENLTVFIWTPNNRPKILPDMIHFNCKVMKTFFWPIHHRSSAHRLRPLVHQDRRFNDQTPLWDIFSSVRVCQCYYINPPLADSSCAPSSSASMRKENLLDSFPSTFFVFLPLYLLSSTLSSWRISPG